MSYVGEIVETSGDNTNLLILSGVSMGCLMALVYSDIPGMFGLPRGAGPGTLRRNQSPYRRIFSFATGGGTGEYARQPPDNFCPAAVVGYMQAVTILLCFLLFRRGGEGGTAPQKTCPPE